MTLSRFVPEFGTDSVLIKYSKNKFRVITPGYSATFIPMIELLPSDLVIDHNKKLRWELYEDATHIVGYFHK